MGRLCDREPLLRSPRGAAAPGDQRPTQLQHGPCEILGRDGDVLGYRRVCSRTADRVTTCLAGAQFRPTLDQLWPPAATAYVRGDLRFRWQCADRNLILCR